MGKWGLNNNYSWTSTGDVCRFAYANSTLPSNYECVRTKCPGICLPAVA